MKRALLSVLVAALVLSGAHWEWLAATRRPWLPIFTAISVSAASLVGSKTVSTANVDLTAVGTSDWILWATNAGDVTATMRKSSGGSQISNYSVAGGVGTARYTGDARTFSWSDGTPTASGSSSAGLFNISGAVTTWTLPADTTSRVAHLHLGVFNGSATMTLHLSDSSASDYTDVHTTGGGAFDAVVYTVTYAAGSASQTLNVEWKYTSGTNYAWLGTDLAVAGGAVTTCTRMLLGVGPC